MAGVFPLNDERLSGLADRFLRALHLGQERMASDYAHALHVEASKLGIANGCGVADILALGEVAIAVADQRVISTAGAGDELLAELDTVCAADVQMRPIQWLWPGRIALGKVTLIAGDPGLGKTQLVLSLAAIVTAGLSWPVSDAQGPRGDVLLLSAEDDAEDTIVPRATAAGADLKRLHIVQAIQDVDRAGRIRRRAANLADDIEAIEHKLAQLDRPQLVIVDPISAYLGRADSHNNAEVRALLAPVSEMAARHRVSVICVSHLSKSSGPKALQRVIGSIAFTAAARAAYLVAREGDSSPRRLLVPLKNNLGNDSGGYAFEIEGCDIGNGIATSRVRWANVSVDVTADELLNADQGPAPGTALDDAAEFLSRTLAHGEVASKQLEAQAAREGLAWRTVERAAKVLDVIKRKERGKAGRWLWSLSPQGRLDDASEVSPPRQPT